MTFITWAFGALTAYLLGLAIYRLFFSPLARANIPGPKLGALSKFYEAYYEIVKKGQLSFKLDELHERYGTTIVFCPVSCWLTEDEAPLSASPPRRSISTTALSGTPST